ncbi:MAG: sulfite exporter TauE/SafE family protein [Pseudomonadota bacterium]
MLMASDPIDLTFAATGALLAGIVRGFSGFGAAMILVPILAATHGPQLAVPVLLLVDMGPTMPLAWRARRHCAWREVLPLATGFLVAMPFGVLVLLAADPVTLTRTMAILVIVVAAAMALGLRRTRPPGLPATLAVGASAGLLSGSTGIGGPPVVLFWLSGQDAAPRTRANVMVYFALSGVIGLVALTTAGLITPEVVAFSLALMVPYGGGLWLGAASFGRTDDATYRRLALGLIAAVGLTILVTSLGSGR